MVNTYGCLKKGKMLDSSDDKEKLEFKRILNMGGRR